MVAAAVVVVLVAIYIGRYAGRGKGNPSARLTAILSVIIVMWLLLAVGNASVATHLAGYGAGGISETVSGVAHFLNDVFK